MKKKLVFFITTFLMGGAEKVLVETVNALDKSKYDITVCVLRGGVLESSLCDKVHYKKIIKTKNKLLSKIFTSLVSFWLPAKIIHGIFIGNKFDYEIAFLEGIPTKIIGASNNKNSVKYAWVHIDLYNTFGLEKVFKSFKKHIECYRKFDKIICVSDSVKTAFIRRFGIKDNIEIKYNTINDNNIKELANEPCEKSDKFRIVSVGRLENQKGYDRLLGSFRTLVSEGFDGELIIVGYGSQRESLEKYVNDNNLSDRVKFTGFSDNPYKYMKSADLLCFPSRAEGYSTVVTEAIILGKPVVVTDCSGMREILGDCEYGLITVNDENAFLNGLRKMIFDETLRKHYTDMAKIRSESFSLNARLVEFEKLFN